MAKKIWTHPKKKNKTYEGSIVTRKVPRRNYVETTFMLINRLKDKFDTFSFESWQQAVKQGWQRK